MSGKEIQVATTELQQAETLLRNLQVQLSKVNDDYEDDELVALRTQNAKLKYRKEFLEQTITQMGGGSTAASGVTTNGSAAAKRRYERVGDSSCMDSLVGVVTDLFRRSIMHCYPDVADQPLSIVTGRPGKGKLVTDYQFNSAMQLAKLMTTKGKPTNPLEFAKNVVSHLPENDIIAKAEVSGPGFVPITLNTDYLCQQVHKLLTNGIQVQTEGPKQRVVVDYSSPNIAKEMHVGHLRSTIIGDCIANLLEFVGHDVLRLNHVGDWGTQFGMLLAHLTEKFPDFKIKPPPITDLQAFYKESKKRFDEDEQFKKRAYDAVVSLQSKQPDMYKAWQLICDISRKEFAAVYKRLNITDGLIERGESFYHDLMKDVVADLEKKNLLVEDEGRKIQWPSDQKEGGSIPLTIVKKDGGFTYDTSDMACIKHRAEVEKADRIVYVTDLGQQPHFYLIFVCARDAGYYDPKKVRLDHAGFGVVLGEDKKRFKTRSGETVRLRDLIDEGTERSLAKLKEKGRDQALTSEELKAAQEAVAIGCIKYADLSKDRKLDYEFSFDRMLDDRGNTAVYLLYMLTRIRSISRNANLDKSPAERARELGKLVLDQEREIKLARYILRFPEVILQVVDDLYPHTLCTYLYDLSVVFSEFYDKHYCIEKLEENGEIKTKIHMNRILLADATAMVMDKGLSLLGIKTLSKM